MRRREFIIHLGGGVALAWPVAARAQQPDRMRRLGVLMGLGADDRESQARLAVFVQALGELGWSRNLAIDTRWCADDPERARAYAGELTALAPDVMLASGSISASALRQATRSIPVVFVQVAEPQGLVESFAKPGRNITGIASIESGVSAKWLALIKEIAPHTRRVMVVRDPDSGAGTGQFAAIQSAAPALGVELAAVGVRDANEIERTIVDFARVPDSGLIVTTSTRASAHRDLIISLAARLRLPAVYPFRFYATAGGLIAYGADWNDQYRRAAGYVDRVLRGEKPADLPVQMPVKYETVLNLKTAKALSLQVPDVVRLRADEVIE
ncbi:MAG TPA: ABC transporter substrate-binding protein [Xanthobacteraceae bacterium]|jgi:putative ABC transport system substrate-binding protein|nr:ABC transporter substrate-binding protein [Xanthobacteraceae bacterium]